MGGDLTVVNAARVSMNKWSAEMTERDEKLIQYLVKHAHSSPFFHVQFQSRLKMPVFLAREWFRHTVGLSRNEVSRRYVTDEPAFWEPVDGLRKQAAHKKQGSSTELVLRESMRKHVSDSVALYKSLLGAGVCPEQARTVLPQSMMTEFIETGSLAAYARIHALRTTDDAQAEIRIYAQEIGRVIAKYAPVSWHALTTLSPDVLPGA